MIPQKKMTKKVYLKKKYEEISRKQAFCTQKKTERATWQKNTAGGKVESNNTPEIPD